MGEDYRIIKNEVSIEEVWWDGNDINEWGYDNGNENEVYKNIDNNVKLLNVTYDDNGNVIPLSERFKDDKSDIRYQSRSINNDYSKALSKEEWASFYSSLTKSNQRNAFRIGDNGILIPDKNNYDSYKLVCYKGDSNAPAVTAVYKLENYDYNIHDGSLNVAQTIIDAMEENYNDKQAKTVFKKYNNASGRFINLTRESIPNRENDRLESNRAGISENAGQGVSNSGVEEDFTQYQLRDNNVISNRELLSNALLKV